MTTERFDKAWLDAAYEQHRRDHPGAPDWGYSFFMAPAERIQSAAVGIIGMNPGGRQTSDNRHWDQPRGLAYLVERDWRGDCDEFAPLQIQIQKMLTALGVEEPEVFAAQMVAFRSPDWKQLAGSRQAVATFEPAWRDLLARSSVRLWLSLGEAPAQQLARLLDAPRITDWEASGWGRTSFGLTQAPSGVVVASLPHLSRYRLFENSASEARVCAFLDRARNLSALA